ncbi:MAG: class I SAM-dependent methyltransferase [Hespellia sp.]|nr:class I SAM-dependent methyltransferase [Hespellia sp.]
MIWDKLSPFYDSFERIYNGKCFKGIAEEIKNHIGEEDIVLECGCGTGLLTVPMAQKCKKLMATDYSEGMLRQTKKKIAKFPNTKLRRVSILEIPFQNNMFDVVVAANVIHLVDNPGKALSEMKRVCKPGGKIIIPTYINKAKKNSMTAAKLLEVIGVKFKRQFSLETYKEFFSKQDIKVLEYKVVQGRMPCAFAIIENLKEN